MLIQVSDVLSSTYLYQSYYALEPMRIELFNNFAIIRRFEDSSLGQLPSTILQ